MLEIVDVSNNVILKMTKAKVRVCPDGGLREIGTFYMMLSKGCVLLRGDFKLGVAEGLEFIFCKVWKTLEYSSSKYRSILNCFLWLL